MSLFKGKYQIKRYSSIVGTEKTDKFQPAQHKNKKHFKSKNLSGSLGKRTQDRFMYKPYKKSISRSMFIELQEDQNIKIKPAVPRDTSGGPGSVIEHRIQNRDPIRGQFIFLSEYDEKPATASISGSIAFGTSISKGSSYTLHNTSTGSITATSWSFFPTVELSKSDGTPIGEINIFGATPYYITSGSERFESVIVKTDSTTNENFQLNHIKVEGDYLDTVTYELTTKVYPLT